MAVDRVIASNLKRLRKRKGMSQQILADAMDVSFQQIQKYENAANRIGAGRLKSAADALGVTPNDFYVEEVVLMQAETRLDRANKEARILLWVFETEGKAREHIEQNLDRTGKISDDDNHGFWLEVEACFNAVVTA